jgi:hypothetical protein
MTRLLSRSVTKHHQTNASPNPRACVIGHIDLVRALGIAGTLKPRKPRRTRKGAVMTKVPPDVPAARTVGLLSYAEYRERSYFPQLDSLRAISVLLVITVHMHDRIWGWLAGTA